MESPTSVLKVELDMKKKKLIEDFKEAKEVEEKSKEYYNQFCHRGWEGVRRFLALHYKFNTRLDTDFWKTCQNETDLAGHWYRL